VKKADIKINKVYTDNKGTEKCVMDIGPQYTLLPGQEDTDCLRYFHTVKKGVVTKQCNSDHTFNTTRESFAKWAKAEVIRTPEEELEFLANLPRRE
jgi:hypothetical protein